MPPHRVAIRQCRNYLAADMMASNRDVVWSVCSAMMFAMMSVCNDVCDGECRQCNDDCDDECMQCNDAWEDECMQRLALCL